MNDNVLLALIVAVPAMLSPLLLSWLTNRNARKDREQDWARQDQVANRVAEVSRQLLARQESTAIALEKSMLATTIAREQTFSQLDAISTMVDGNVTVVLQAELESTQRELTALREIMEIKRTAGQTASADATMVIATAVKRIVELQKLLADRRERDAVARSQIDSGNRRSYAAEAAALAAPAAAEKAARKIVPPVVTEVVPPVVKAAVKEALAEHDKGK